MQLVYANDFEAVKKIYIDVIENTPLIEQYARWVYGKHPNPLFCKTIACLR